MILYTNAISLEISNCALCTLTVYIKAMSRIKSVWFVCMEIGGLISEDFIVEAVYSSQFVLPSSTFSLVLDILKYLFALIGLAFNLRF